MSLLFFTDLDGTLLDHDDYSWDAARPALDRLQREGLPLVFVTSKTRREVEPLREEIGSTDPFVVENGAAVLFPDSESELEISGSVSQEGYRVVILGKPYDQVRRFVARVGPRFGIRGFADMSVSEVAELTGLPDAEAALARQREYTEPFLLTGGGDLERLRREAAGAGLAITTGGRLHHLMGAGQSKGRAVRIVRDVLVQADGEPATTVGLGDSPNDLPMLEVVDIAVVVPRPNGSQLELDRPGVRVAERPGSRGWNEAVGRILDAWANGLVVTAVEEAQGGEVNG